ncbi:MAG TPA: hypothetical protein H9768_01010 [Candidatus Mailhella merdavium]|nr:hypothetical protein [Candidatus Mailhella merdavium]
MNVLLVLIVCLLAAGLIVLLCALRTLTRSNASPNSSHARERRGTADDTEADLQTLVNIVEKLEKRIDVLETLLDRHDGKSPSGRDSDFSHHDSRL